jgi:hypothetical protein
MPTLPVPHGCQNSPIAVDRSATADHCHLIATSIIVFNLFRLFMRFWMISTFVIIRTSDYFHLLKFFNQQSSTANHGHWSTNSHYMHGFEKLSQLNEMEWHEMGIFDLRETQAHNIDMQAETRLMKEPALMASQQVSVRSAVHWKGMLTQK